MDSAVCTALLNAALGPQNVVALHIDNGFMRKEESVKVKASLENLGLRLHGNCLGCHGSGAPLLQPQPALPLVLLFAVME